MDQYSRINIQTLRFHIPPSCDFSRFLNTASQKCRNKLKFLSHLGNLNIISLLNVSFGVKNFCECAVKLVRYMVTVTTVFDHL